MPKPRPHENTYWVTSSLLTGEYPRNVDAESQSAKLAKYLDAGVDVYIDLTEPGELTAYHERLAELAAARGIPPPEYHRRPIRDRDITSPAAMAATLDLIDASLADGRTVYVHCWGGVGRTGTVVGCYLVRHGQTGDQALATLAQHWTTVEKRHRHPRTPETTAQRQYILHWSQHDPHPQP